MLLLDAAARPDAGEIGSGPGLREPLAPDLVPGEEWRQVARLLLLGPMGHDRRPGHAEPDHAHVRRRLGTRQLLEQDRLVRDRRARAAVLLRPRQPGVTRSVECAAPGAHRGEVVRLQAEAVAAQLLGDVVGEPRAQLGPERRLLRGVAKVHRGDGSPRLRRGLVRAASHAPVRCGREVDAFSLCPRRQAAGWDPRERIATLAAPSRRW